MELHLNEEDLKEIIKKSLGIKLNTQLTINFGYNLNQDRVYATVKVPPELKDKILINFPN